MRPISFSKTNDIIQSLISGKSYGKISIEHEVSKSTVYNISTKNKLNRSDDQIYEVRNPTGRPRKLNERDERTILRIIESGECETAVEVSRYLSKNLKMCISASTIRRTLRKNGMKSTKKVKKPFLSSKHRKARYEFAKRYKNWTINDWKHVVWSDETKINRFGCDGRKWCWKSKKEILKSRHVDPTLKFGGGQ